MENITIASCKYVEVEDGTTAIVYFLNRFGINNAVVNKPFLDDDENTFIPVLGRKGNLSLHRDLNIIQIIISTNEHEESSYQIYHSRRQYNKICKPCGILG